MMLDAGKPSATLGAKGTTRLPRQTSTISIKDGELSDFSTTNRAMRSELTLEYIATYGQDYSVKVDFPYLMIKIPLSTMVSSPVPIPIYICFGLSLNTAINLPSVTSFAHAKTNRYASYR
jgi:hypothetical protein